jgi:putative tricarboxylic transport membrane protein
VNRDLVLGVAGATIATSYCGLAASIPESALADAVGPQGLPIVYGVVLLLLSLILIVRALRTWNREPRTPDPGSRVPDPRVHLTRVAGMLAIGAAYIALVPWLGYIVALAGLIFATTWYQSGAATRTTALVAAAGAIVFWLVFVALLGIPQPPGVWGELF